MERSLSINTNVTDARRWSDWNAVNQQCRRRQLMLAATCCSPEDFGFYLDLLEFILVAMSAERLQKPAA